MFHFPAFPPHCLCVQQRVTAHDDCRVSPFGHPRIKARLTAPRGLSRPPTSFIGSWCQGIHRAPLKTWPQMLASTVQFSNNDQTPTHTTRPAGVSVGPALKQRPYGRSLRTQQRARHTRPFQAFHAPKCSTHKKQPCVPNSQRSTHELTNPGHSPESGHVLLRKEVIQPHLPVRLPCYDFVPIAGPTFDGSSPYGLGHRLRVLPTFVT